MLSRLLTGLFSAPIVTNFDIGDFVTDGTRTGVVASEPQPSPYYSEEIQGVERIYVIGEGWSDYWLESHITSFPNYQQGA